MDKSQLGHGLEFNDNLLLHEQVDSVAQINGNILVVYREWDFRSNAKLPVSELCPKALLINFLEQARSKGLMDFDGCINNGARDLIEFHFPSGAPVLCGSFPTSARRGFRFPMILISSGENNDGDRMSDRYAFGHRSR